MAKHALLIGSPTFGLEAVGIDLDEMAGLLGDRGFDCRRCYREAATRDGILGAYHALIADTAAGDAVVVYYSGHGARAAPVGGPEYQFICPWDYDPTGAGEFRGVLDVELSDLMTRLADRTANVTAVFDCCHAAGMSRAFGPGGPRLRPRSLPRVREDGVRDHLAALRARGLAVDRLGAAGHPHVVRLVATAASQLAFEFDDETGRPRGLLTWALCAALREAGGRRVSWRVVADRIRRLVQSLAPTQRPEAEGPAERAVFEATEAPADLAVVVEGGRYFLAGGRVHGVEVGDRYRVLADDPAVVAAAEIVSVEPARSLLNLRPDQSGLPTAAHLRAVPAALAPRRWAVRIDGATPALDRVRWALPADGAVRSPAAGDDEPPLATVGEVAGEVTVCDAAGRVLTTRRAETVTGEDVAGELQKLARARALVTLPSGDGPAALPPTYAVDWGRVDAGRRVAPPDRDDPLRVGERVYLAVRNLGARPLYVHFFDIGLSAAVTHLNRSYPSGVEVPPGGEYVLGEAVDRGLVGREVRWPVGLPEDGPREETVVVLLFDRPCALDGVGHSGIRSRAAGEPSRAWGLILSGRRTRDLGYEPDVAGVRYATVPITFAVDPRRA